MMCRRRNFCFKVFVNFAFYLNIMSSGKPCSNPYGAAVKKRVADRKVCNPIKKWLLTIMNILTSDRDVCAFSCLCG